MTRAMARYHGPKDRLDAAQDPSTPAQELGRLAESEHIFVREAVAANPGTPEAVLEAMVPRGLEKDHDYEVVIGLIHNSRLPSHCHGRIAQLLAQAAPTMQPREFYPRLAVKAFFECSNTPLDAQMRFLDSGSLPSHLLAAIISVTRREEVLRRLVQDASEKTRRRARRALDRMAPPNEKRAEPT